MHSVVRFEQMELTMGIAVKPPPLLLILCTAVITTAEAAPMVILPKIR